MERIIGIDLGTTNSVVSLIKDGKAQIINGPNGEKLLPSVVGLDPAGQLLVGTEALRQYAADPMATAKSVKRHMGTDHQYTLRDRTFSASEISSLILRELKSWVETAIGETVTKAVITVPAYFSDAQRQATKQAGELAGLEVMRILNEPTAAALAYSADEEHTEHVLVYDLGGGTFDVSIVELSGSVTEVLASHGNNMLGGDDFDRKLQHKLQLEFERQHGVDLSDNKRAMARLNRAAEATKVKLSSHAFVDIKEEFLDKKGDQPLHLEMTIERKEFEELIRPLVESTLESIDRAMQDAELDSDEIDRIVLAGGSTRIPLVKQLLAEHLELPLYDAIDPDLCVAMGAAYHAGVLSGESLESILVDVTPYSLGVRAIAEDEIGLPNINYFSVIIPRNTVVPVSRSEEYSNPIDDQTKVQIEVYQGENPDVNGNIQLGEVWVEDLPPAPAGHMKVEVTFDFDINGILHVSARERTSNKEARTTITPSSSQLTPPQLKSVREKLERLYEGQEEQGEELDEEISDSEDGDLIDVEESLELTDQQASVCDRVEAALGTIEDKTEYEDLHELYMNYQDAIRNQDAAKVLDLEAEINDVLYYMESEG